MCNLIIYIFTIYDNSIKIMFITSCFKFIITLHGATVVWQKCVFLPLIITAFEVQTSKVASITSLNLVIKQEDFEKMLLYTKVSIAASFQKSSCFMLKIYFYMGDIAVCNQCFLLKGLKLSVVLCYCIGSAKSPEN